MDDQSREHDVGGQIRDSLRVLREQWWLILLCVALTTGAAAAYTSRLDKEYEASAKLLLQPDNLNSTIAGTELAGTDPTRQANTDAQLAALPAVAARVTKELDMPLSATAIRTRANPDSNILTVSVTDRDPARAALFANEFAQQFIVFRRDTTRKRFRRALSTLQTRLARARRGTPEFAALRAQSKQLRLLVSLQTGDAELVQEATPPGRAVRPRPFRNVALGAIAGLLLGLGFAVLRDRLDRRIKREDEVEALLPDVPVLGLIPHPRRGRTGQLMTGEAFHTLQANVALLSRRRPLKTLLITSAAPGEGKSTVALNLALAMRAVGRRPLVLDADLRRPSLSQLLDADARVGVSSILAGEGTVGSSIQRRSVEPPGNGNGPMVALAGEVSLVAAGSGTASVPLLLNETSLGALLRETRDRDECVIFDGPPVGSFGDMLPLAKEVDGVILVVRLYASRMDHVKRLVAQLESAAIDPIGVVILGRPSLAPPGYYAGYYAES